MLGYDNRPLPDTEPPECYSLEQVQAEAIKIGLTDKQAEEWYYHYAAQGFRFGNNMPIRSLPAALVRWRNNQYKFEKSGKTKLFPISGKNCSKCKMPAVYKASGGGYDYWYCAEHMPEKIKEKYE